MTTKEFAIDMISKGSVILNPKYSEQELQEYAGNPLIEALPYIYEDDVVDDIIKSYPLFNESDRNMRQSIRYHMIRRLKDLVITLPKYFELERNISMAIRRGYISRNPCSPEYLSRLRYLREIEQSDKCNLLDDVGRLGRTPRSTAGAISFFGISGAGKSMGCERILLSYPQVIYHSEYKGKSITKSQITWMKIDCPHDCLL